MTDHIEVQPVTTDNFTCWRHWEAAWWLQRRWDSSLLDDATRRLLLSFKKQTMSSSKANIHRWHSSTSQPNPKRPPVLRIGKNQPYDDAFPILRRPWPAERLFALPQARSEITVLRPPVLTTAMKQTFRCGLTLPSSAQSDCSSKLAS